MESPDELHTDPLYLSALASLGVSVPQKLIAAPINNSIAVLPFVNMSADPEQEFFTDGLSEDTRPNLYPPGVTNDEHC